MPMHLKERQNIAPVAPPPDSDAVGIGAALQAQNAMVGLESSRQQLAGVVSEQTDVVGSANASLSVVLDMLGTQSNEAYSDLNTVQDNKTKIAQNPFSEILGIFNPDYNPEVQRINAESAGLKLQQVAQTGQRAQKMYDLAIAESSRTVTHATNIYSSNVNRLSNMSAGLALVQQARGMTNAASKDAAENMTSTQLVAEKARLEAGGEAGNVQLGDIVSTQAKNAKAIKAMADANKADMTSLKDMDSAIDSVLSSQSDTMLRGLQKMAQADPTGMAILPTMPNLKIPLHKIENQRAIIGLERRERLATGTALVEGDREDALMLNVIQPTIEAVASITGLPVAINQQEPLLDADGNAIGYANQRLDQVIYLNGNPVPGTGISTENLTPELGQALTAYSMAAQAFTNSPTEANRKLMFKEGTDVRARVEKEREDIIEATPKDNKAGMRQYFNHPNRHMTNLASSAPVVFDSVISGGSAVTDPSWLPIANVFRQSLIKQGADTAIDLKGDNLIAALFTKKTKKTKQQMIAIALGTPEMKQAQQVFISNASEELFNNTIKRLSAGDTALSKFFGGGIVNNRRLRTANGDLSVNAVVDHLNSLNEKARSFGAITADETLGDILIADMRENLPKFARNRFKVNSPVESGLLQASFSNNPVGLVGTFVAGIEQTFASRRGQ